MLVSWRDAFFCDFLKITADINIFLDLPGCQEYIVHVSDALPGKEKFYHIKQVVNKGGLMTCLWRKRSVIEVCLLAVFIVSVLFFMADNAFAAETIYIQTPPGFCLGQ